MPTPTAGIVEAVWAPQAWALIWFVRLSKCNFRHALRGKCFALQEKSSAYSKRIAANLQDDVTEFTDERSALLGQHSPLFMQWTPDCNSQGLESLWRFERDAATCVGEIAQRFGG